MSYKKILFTEPKVTKLCVEQGIAVHIDKPAGQDLQVFEDTLRIAKISVGIM